MFCLREFAQNDFVQVEWLVVKQVGAARNDLTSLRRAIVFVASFAEEFSGGRANGNRSEAGQLLSKVITLATSARRPLVLICWPRMQTIPTVGRPQLARLINQQAAPLINSRQQVNIVSRGLQTPVAKRSEGSLGGG